MARSRSPTRTGPLQLQLLLLLPLLPLAALADADAPSEPAARPDYSRYFPSADREEGPAAAPEAESAGFVRPIDFSELLARARAGAGGEAVAASSSRVAEFFRSASDAEGSADTPFGGFRAAPADNNNNSTAGFTSPRVSFPSLFDASGAAAAAGFRPQDFLGRPRDAAAAEPAPARRPYPETPAADSAQHRGNEQTDRSRSHEPHQRSYDSPKHFYDSYNSPQRSYEPPQRSYEPKQRSSEPKQRPYESKHSHEPKKPSGEYKEHDYEPKQYSYGYPQRSYDHERLAFDPPPARYAESAPVREHPEHQRAGGEAANQQQTKPDGKNCKKIDKTISADDLKKGRFRREAAMTCYLCEDPKTGGKYEECSYATEPTSGKYFIGHAQSYSTDRNPQPTTYRYRRDLADFLASFRRADYDLDDAYASPDPVYERPSRLADIRSYVYGPGDYSRNSDYTVDYSAEPADKKDCRKIQKKSSTCYVCKDPATGGNYEQCSYAAQPKGSNYFVARQASYDSGNPGGRYRRDDGNRVRGRGADPYLYGSAQEAGPSAEDRQESENSAAEGDASFYAPYGSYEEYFRHLFPELTPREASASDQTDAAAPAPAPYNYEGQAAEYFSDNERKKDLDAVLGEFAQKDRTACTKLQKDKMTCYLCVDAKGVQNEECMFVAASEPRSQHLAYRELKQFSLMPPRNGTQPGNRSEMQAAASDRRESRRAPDEDERDSERDSERDHRGADGEQSREQSPERGQPAAEPAPPELSQQDRTPDGLYSAETRRRFDPVLKVTLPEYMLSRSEHEAIFDEVMASG